LRLKQPHSLTRSADRALYAKLATVSFLRALRQVVDSTVGDVVQLVRTLAPSLVRIPHCHGARRTISVFSRLCFQALAPHS
jgi:hypothetical protein